MGSNNIIVREYLENLKEDGELDALFPILINLMGFRIVATAKEAKGQSQYGKDIIAIGKDEQGIKHRYYFELKGHADKDITDKNYSSKDGVRESIIEAKDTAFNDSSIPAFNSLPIKIVFVHNGIMKTNIRPTFEGFIAREFKDGEFERWDIFYLTDLFSQYLFNENLLTDEQSLRLFKRTLILLDAPENDFNDFRTLFDLQIEKIGETKKGRSFHKFFATQILLGNVILHYSIENGNLEPAKQCLTYLLLKTWSWVLLNKLETKPSVTREFRKLVSLHYKMLDNYFVTTFPVASTENGLYSERGGFFEEAGFPLRSFEYLNYFIYYCQARQYYPRFLPTVSAAKRTILLSKQKAALKLLIENNDGCYRAVMDYHSITVLNVFRFVLDQHDEDDMRFVADYLVSLFDNIVITQMIADRFPLLSQDPSLLIKAMASGKKEGYEDRSSLLIMILFELATVLTGEFIYDSYKPGFEGKINLQTAYPNFKAYDIEQLLFEKHFDQEFYVETNLSLKSSFKDFREWMCTKPIEKINYRTDKAGFSYLRTLAHIYYKNEFFPDFWRIMLVPNKREDKGNGAEGTIE
ncbi:hypothetical protein [Pedobacter sp. N23S346]|uniref:hypothetical protein n=1 Tax=Pedobacter sp. N23S346 TaxID=3402750 RepID=UPI003AD2AD2D